MNDDCLTRKLFNLTVKYDVHSDLLREDESYFMFQDILDKHIHRLSSNRTPFSYVPIKTAPHKFLAICTDKDLKQPLRLFFFDMRDKKPLLAVDNRDIDICNLPFSYIDDRCKQIGSEFMRNYETPQMLMDAKQLFVENNYYKEERY